jgi:RNA polymerase sigma factor FliA
MEAEVKAFEPRELWRRYKEGGDGSARERLVVAYSPLVKFLAGRTGARLPSHVDQADLISYGMFGLIEAMERFEPRRQIRFETFAMQRIRGAIIDELRSLDWVPRSVRSRARDIEEVKSKLEHELGRASTDDELAGPLGMSEDHLRQVLLQISNSAILALDELWMTPDASGDRISLLDTIEDESAADPQAALDTSEARTGSPRRSRTCPSARPWSSRCTTSRTSRSGRSARFWESPSPASRSSTPRPCCGCAPS